MSHWNWNTAKRGEAIPPKIIDSLKVYDYEELDNTERGMVTWTNLVIGIEEVKQSAGQIDLRVVDGLPPEIGGWACVMDGMPFILMPRASLKQPDVYLLDVVHELYHHITGAGDDEPDFKTALARFNKGLSKLLKEEAKKRKGVKK